jgi:hypothetical protein
MSIQSVPCQLAKTGAHYESVFRLRSHCMAAGSADLFVDAFDQTINHFSFLHPSAEHPTATIRVSVVKPELGWIDSPAREWVGAEDFLEGGFVAASHLCFEPSSRRDGFVSLIGNLAALARLFHTKWVLVCPPVEQVTAYQNVFGFQPRGVSRKMPGACRVGQLMAVSLSQLLGYIEYDPQIGQCWERVLQRLSCLRSDQVQSCA